MTSSSNSSSFKGRDLDILAQLKYKPDTEPGYCWVKSSLIWEDEIPTGLTPDAYERLCYLWIARSYIHRDKWADCPDYYRIPWEEERRAGLKWPGFERLKITDEDRLRMKEGQRALEEEVSDVLALEGDC